MFGYGNQVNGYYPQYQPQMQQMPMQDNLQQLRSQQLLPTQMSATTGGDDRIWIQGEVGAKAYIVAPGNTVPLWDSESQTIYLKSVNAAGIPSMQKLTYAFDEQRPSVNMDQFITREEFEKVISELKEQKDAVQ